MRWVRSAWVGFGLGAVALVGACNLFRTPPPPRGGDGSVKCGGFRVERLAALAAWDADARKALSEQRASGAVAVRYQVDGCNVELEVLKDCHATEKYAYAPQTKLESVVAHDLEELYGAFPVGAASLGAKVGGDRAVRVDTSLVGVHSLPLRDPYRTSELVGADCERATHIVGQIYVGGLSVATGPAAAADEAVSPFAPKSKPERLLTYATKESEPAACAKAVAEGRESAACSTPLRIGLLPIEGRSTSGCAAGAASDGLACVAKATLGENGCPPGMKADGNRCFGAHASACPKGTRLAAGRCAPIEDDAGAATASTDDAGPSSAPPPAPEGMVYVPSGSFQMGTADGDPHERPVHSVRVQGFFMDRTEVTVEAFAECVRAGACSGFAVDATCNSPRSPEKVKHPVNCLEWTEAMEYCRWAKKRLPTEEEWEYAARGSDGRRYPWGETAPGIQLCWNGEGNNVGKGSRKTTCPVGSFPTGKSPFGVLDMAGNVAEWTASPFTEGYGQDPVEDTRVVRGGSFDHANPNSVRSTLRMKSGLTSKTRHLVGFRCAQDLPR